MVARRIASGFALVAGLLVAAEMAFALDQRLDAGKLALRLLPSGAERLVFIARDHVWIPGSGDFNNPVERGATVEILAFNAARASFSIPAGLGSPGWRWLRDDSGYVYANRLAPGGPSPVRYLKARLHGPIRIVI